MGTEQDIYNKGFADGVERGKFNILNETNEFLNTLIENYDIIEVVQLFSDGDIDRLQEWIKNR